MSAAACPGSRRRRRIALGVLCAVLLILLAYIAYVFLAYYRLEDDIVLPVSGQAGMAGQAVEKDTAYRVVSYNIGFGAYSADFSFFMDGGAESRARSPEAVRENVGGAAGALRMLDGDFLLLQEVDVDGTRSHRIDEAGMLLERLDGYAGTFVQNYDSPYLFWPPLEPHGANRSGLLTLSRFPINAAVRRRLPVEEGVMKLVDLDRCYAVHRIPVAGGGELVLYNVHLSAYTSDGTIAEEQMAMLFSDMLEEYQKGNYVIAGGDFNKDLLGNSAEIFGVSGEDYTWAQPVPAELVPAGLTLVAPLDESCPVPSCRNADRPYGPEDFVLVVDGFAVSDNVTVTASSAMDTGFQWSDHNPVYLDFILENG